MANPTPAPHCRKSAARHRVEPALTAGRFVALAVFGVVLASCSSGADAPTPPPPPAPGPTGPVGIKQFTGDNACIELENKIESTVIEMMREQLKSVRRYPFAAPEAGGGVANGTTGGDAVSAPTSPAPSAEADNRYSETNVQVGGVDELDPVKNDGNSLFSLTTNGPEIIFTHAALRPASNMRVIGQSRWPAAASDIRIPREQPIGLFRIDENNVVALTSSNRFFAYPLIDTVGPDITATVARDSICIDTGCGPIPQWLPPRTHVRLFGTSASQAPVQNWQVNLPGQLIEARRIDRKVYLVSQATLQLPPQVRWWPDAPYDSTEERWQAALADLLERNGQIITQRSLAQWLAPLGKEYPLNPDSPPPQPTAAQCSQFATVDASTRLGWLRVSTIDLDTRSVDHQTVLAQGSAVYMSARSLIVSTPFWEPFVGSNIGAPVPVGGSSTRTFLHRFALDPQGQAKYTSSGTIDGRLINRFAIDEASDGMVRVAGSSRANGRSISYLATLKEQGGELKLLGRSADIAPGETLRSARFVKDRAYLVTAVVIDPFFVFDMSDPVSPRELGQLKIPGFSSYLHPVGDNHVLGIGYDDTGWPRRIKASLFDVTNPSSPVEQAVLSLGNTYTGSDALWDPHAFTLYYPDQNSTEAVMAIPVRSYGRAEYGTSEESGIRLVDVAPGQPAQALRLRGTLEMSDLLYSSSRNNGWRSTDPRRAVFINQTVYGVSDAAIRAVDLSDPGTAVGTLTIP